MVVLLQSTKTTHPLFIFKIQLLITGLLMTVVCSGHAKGTDLGFTEIDICSLTTVSLKLFAFLSRH